jgi:uncharacterized membrane protein YfcA
MPSLAFIGLLVLGVIAGYLSGLIGIGGGVIIVPALVMIFGFNQHLAQGTTIALLIPPIGILAAMNYYQKGFVDIKTAAIICIGFVLGGYLGSMTALNISQEVVRKFFALVVIVLGIKMFFFHR